MRFVASKVLGLVVFAMIFLPAIPAQAQDDETWGYAVNTYLWGAGLDGEVAARGRSVEIDQSFGEILEHLEFGFAGVVRAHKGTWAVTGEFMYMGLGATVGGSNPIEVDVDQWMIAGDVGYQVAESVEVLGGARVMSLQNKFQSPFRVTVEVDKTWVDPVVGIRFAPRLSEKWQLWTRFDIGGFEVGSDLTWQLNANAVWQFSDRSALTFGYRVLDIKYDDEKGDNEFVYDATSHGPITGLVFTF